MQDTSYTIFFVVLFHMEKKSPVSDMWFSSFYSHDFQVILLLFHQHCTSAVRRISHITGVWSLAVSCVLATFWITVIPDNSNLRRKGSFGVTVGEFRGCGGKLEVETHRTRNQEAETQRGLCLDYFLLFSQFRTPVHGMVPRIGLDLSTSDKSSADMLRFSTFSRGSYKSYQVGNHFLFVCLFF